MKKLSAEKVKQRFTSIRAWELPKQSSAIAPDYVWTNKDMDVTPPEDQTWTIWSIMAYWVRLSPPGLPCDRARWSLTRA